MRGGAPVVGTTRAHRRGIGFNGGRGRDLRRDPGCASIVVVDLALWSPSFRPYGTRWSVQDGLYVRSNETTAS